MTTATCIILALNSLWCNLIFDTRYDDNAIESVSPFYIPDGDPSGKVVRITGNYAKGMMSTYSAWWERVMYNYDSSADNIWNDYALTNMAFKGTVGASVLAHGDYFIDQLKPVHNSQLATVAFRNNGPDPRWGSTTNRVVSSLTRILDFEWFKRLFSDAKSLQNQDDISCSKMLDTEYWGEHDYQDMGLTGWLEHPKAMGWKWWEHLWPVAHATGTTSAGANNPIAPSGVSRRTLDTLVERSLYDANFWIDPDDQTPHVQEPMGLDLFNDMYKQFVTNRCWKFIVGGPGPRVDFFQQSAVNRLINFYDTSYVAQDNMAPLLPWRRTFYDTNCSTGCIYIANGGEYGTNALYTIDWSIYPYQLKMLPYNDYAYHHSTNWSGDSAVEWSSSQRASNCVFAAKFTGDTCSMSVTPEVPLFANITWTILTNAMEHLVPGGMVPEAEARLITKTSIFGTWPAWHFTAENITTNEYIADLDFFFPTSFPQTVVYDFEFKNTGKIATSELIDPDDDDAPPCSKEIITPAITRPTTNAFNLGLVRSAVASSMESKTWGIFSGRYTIWSHWPATGPVEPYEFIGPKRIRVSGASNGCNSHDELASAMITKMSALRSNLVHDGQVIPSAFLADARATIPVCGYNEVLEDFFSTKLPALTGGGNPPFELMWQDFLKPSGQGFVRIARGYDPDCFWIEGHEVFPGGSLIAAELATGSKIATPLLKAACDETESFNRELHLFYSGAIIDFMTKIKWNYFNLK